LIDEIRFVSTTLWCSFEDITESNNKLFKDEYNLLSESENDTIGQWLKSARSRGETSESDQVLLTLLVELHKKVDYLESLIKNKANRYISLKSSSTLAGIHFDYIKISQDLFQESRRYYMRIDMPIFPKREIPIFVEAIDSKTAYISSIGQKNIADWNTYITSRERELIRESKGIRV
jgi:hypothetical protein